MKIAYVTFERPSADTGVGKKLLSQAAAWRSAGHEVRHYVLNTSPSMANTENVEYLFSRDMAKPMIGAMFANAKLRSALKLFSPDIIYTRQMLWWPGAVWALNTAPLVIEVNSDMREEYVKASRLKTLICDFSASFFLEAAVGLVAVTSELLQRIAHPVSSKIVIGNGYDFMQASRRRPPVNVRPQVVFVGSPGQPWHGIDKITRLAASLPDFDFHLVVPDYYKDGPSNLICHGGLYGEDLNSLYEKADAALSTLALHRKNMHEASPLKTREYLAYGIPVIGGYKDTELADVEYFINIGNHERNVDDNVDLIAAFIRRWQTRSLPHDDVVSRLSYKNKEIERLAFFESVMAR